MLDVAKKSLLEIWPANEITREFHTDEKMDSYLQGWSDWINRFSVEDYSDAVKAIKLDIVTESLGRELDRASLAVLLQYCKTMQKNRKKLTASQRPKTEKQKSYIKKLSKWLDATNPKVRKLTEAERTRRREVRARVFAKSGTTISTLRVSRFRNSIGDDLMDRLIKATAKEAEKITE